MEDGTKPDQYDEANWSFLALHKRAEPHRYSVALMDLRGDVYRYTICTWMAQEKAIVIAALYHYDRHREPVEAIVDVVVEDLGYARSRVSREGKKYHEAEDDDLIQDLEW